MESTGAASVYSVPMTETRIKAVAFDAVGTLFHSRGTIGQIYRNVALKYGRDVSAFELQRGFEREAAGRGTPADRAGWRGLVEAVFREHGAFPDFDDFFEEVYAFFQSGRGWMCYPEAGEVLGALNGRGVPMAVVSNFDRRLYSVLRDLEIDSYFTAVVIPDSAGHAKPDPRIFIDATVQLETFPAETLFVGDDPALDIQGARAAGLPGILVDREDGGPRPGAVSDLRGILGLVGS